MRSNEVLAWKSVHVQAFCMDFPKLVKIVQYIYILTGVATK